MWMLTVLLRILPAVTVCRFLIQPTRSSFHPRPGTISFPERRPLAEALSRLPKLSLILTFFLTLVNVVLSTSTLLSLPMILQRLIRFVNSCSQLLLLRLLIPELSMSTALNMIMSFCVIWLRMLLDNLMLLNVAGGDLWLPDRVLPDGRHIWESGKPHTLSLRKSAITLKMLTTTTGPMVHAVLTASLPYQAAV